VPLGEAPLEDRTRALHTADGLSLDGWPGQDWRPQEISHAKARDHTVHDAITIFGIPSCCRQSLQRLDVGESKRYLLRDIHG